MRMHPIYHVWMMHNGTDLTGLPYGSPIYAVHEGDISWVGPYGGLGNYVEINHGAGIITGYGHMSSFAPGIQYAFITGHTVHVTAGQVIGYLGSTGDSTGVHLHYSVRLNGKFVDPVIFMQQIGLPLIAH
jgi:murein DD-endopeptidase MepM/ murein hydrolase activator NlpD